MTKDDKIRALEALVDAAELAFNELQDAWVGGTTDEIKLFKDLLSNYRRLFNYPFGEIVELPELKQ